jgi:cell division protein FtsQ
VWHDVKTLNAASNGLMVIITLACLSAGLWWLAQHPMFTLTTIRIETLNQSTLRHVSHLTVRNGALGKIRGNFFTANLDTARQAFESVPWVRRASVRREWPNQLIVALEEYEALGTWGEDGRLLSTMGEVFTANLAEAEEDRALLEFSGPDGSEKEVLHRYRQLGALFAPIKLVPQGLALSSRYAWTVTLDNGMSVALGREQSMNMLKDRVDRLTGIYPQLASRLEQIDTIDMRYPNGLALSSHGMLIDDGGKKPAIALKINHSQLNRRHLQ